MHEHVVKRKKLQIHHTIATFFSKQDNRRFYQSYKTKRAERYSELVL